MKKAIQRTLKIKTLKGPLTAGGKRLKMEIDGLPVFDAKEPLELEVNEVDIIHSNRLSPDSCAAAVALMRQEHTTSAYVYRTKVYLKRDTPRGSYSSWYERYQVPLRLRLNATAHDQEGNFSPGEYRLSVVSPSQSALTLGKKRSRTVVLTAPSKSRKLGNGAKNRPSPKKTKTLPRRYAAIKVRPRPAGFIGRKGYANAS